MNQQAIARENLTQVTALIEKAEKRQNLTLGIIGGIIAAIISALIWGAITAWTGWQIGWMAVGVGFLVGFAVRICGKGITMKFGVIGALLALLGCLAGNILAVYIMASRDYGVPLLDLLTTIDFQIITDILKETFAWVDLVFYALALYEGYKFSFRKIDW